MIGALGNFISVFFRTNRGITIANCNTYMLFMVATVLCSSRKVTNSKHFPSVDKECLNLCNLGLFVYCEKI